MKLSNLLKKICKILFCCIPVSGLAYNCPETSAVTIKCDPYHCSVNPTSDYEVATIINDIDPDSNDLKATFYMAILHTKSIDAKLILIKEVRCAYTINNDAHLGRFVLRTRRAPDIKTTDDVLLKTRWKKTGSDSFVCDGKSVGSCIF